MSKLMTVTAKITKTDQRLDLINTEDNNLYSIPKVKNGGCGKSDSSNHVDIQYNELVILLISGMKIISQQYPTCLPCGKTKILLLFTWQKIKKYCCSQ